MTIESREIIERIRLKMPIVVTLPDPITGEPFNINRDNILAMLVVDLNNLAFEAQTVSALFAEMARIRAAANRAQQELEVRFRVWKMQKRNECRAQNKDKRPTKEELEDYYRGASDYQERYQEKINMAVLVSLADDLKKAFELKAKALHDLSGETYGHNQMQNASERLCEVELERLAMETTEQSGSAAAAADFRERGQQPEDKPETETAARKPPSKKKAGGKNPRPLKRGKAK